ncbi:MAG: ribonuclease III [Proteobacteria bacterium]|nr:ribonuclease III [Pseudomonadota bacterium]
MQKYKDAAQELGLEFKDAGLLKQAFVHRSYLNEHHSFSMEHNERLEFLGDAVLELVVTEFLYKNYKNPEGEMTNWRASLVNSQSLAETGRELKLEKYLLLSKGESKDKNPKARNYILANTVEAVIGAIYLDSGFEPTAEFITKHILAKLPNILKNKLYLDSKTHFQELSQEKFGITPTYRLISEEGPDHNKIFEIGVYIGNDLIAKGGGSSKQEAQMDAAAEGLKTKGWS